MIIIINIINMISIIIIIIIIIIYGLEPCPVRGDEAQELHSLLALSEALGLSVDLGFSNGTLERRYSRIMLSPPQNTKPYLGHEG